MNRYAVMGNPIQHSLSPRIHSLFAEQTKIPLIYEAIHVSFGGLAQALDDFQAQAGKGVNITAPFKQEAYALVDQVSARAERAKVINTISFLPNGQRLGDNTDGLGFMQDLINNQHHVVRGMRILLIGAGGAARGILGPLLDAAPKQVVIVNRSYSKAQELTQEFAGLCPISAHAWPEIPSQHYDLIINSTNAANLWPLPDYLASETSVYYDLMYAADGDTPFILSVKAQNDRVSSRRAGTKTHITASEAQNLSAKTLGTSHYHTGLGMLIEQAAESFYIWHGIRPHTGLLL